jgi:hypothetical protein
MFRHATLIAMFTMACSGDGGGGGNGSGSADAAVDADTAAAHEVVACDTASWQVAIPGLPDGYQCERACQVYEQPTGPACASDCGSFPSGSSTFDYEGLRGCCNGSGPSEPFRFCECED